MDDVTIWKNGVSTNVSSEQKQALDLWLKYNTLAYITEEIDKPTATIRDWIYTGRNGMRPFIDIRNDLEKTQLRELSKHKMPIMRSIMDSSLHVIMKTLSDLKKGGAPLSIEDIKKISDIASNMDKILKLDAGQATENVAVARINPISSAQDIKNILNEVDDFNLFDITEEQ